jgi:hypothetical protein
MKYLALILILGTAGCGLLNPDGSVNKEATGEAVSSGSALAAEGVVIASGRIDDPDWFSFGEKVILWGLGLAFGGGAAVKGAIALKNSPGKPAETVET